MSDVHNVASGSEGGSLTPDQAWEAYVARQDEKKAPEIPQEASAAEPATPDNELAVEANAESPETETTAPDETTAAEPEAPAIDPPKSWTKEARERWANLDPATQQWLVERDREDQAAIKRSFNEAAEQRKAVEAELEQAKQERQKTVDAQKRALAVLEREQLRDFPDIRTIEDVRRLADEDPFRFQKWQAHQYELQAAHTIATQAEREAETERQTEWTKHVQSENAKFIEQIPEFADKAKAAELTQKAIGHLQKLGFTDDDLGRYANGKDRLSIFDHRVQRLIFDGIKYSELKASPPKAVPPNLPNVQKPGVATSRSAVAAEEVKALTAKLNRTGSEDDAFALYQARRKSAGR